MYKKNKIVNSEIMQKPKVSRVFEKNPVAPILSPSA